MLETQVNTEFEPWVRKILERMAAIQYSALPEESMEEEPGGHTVTVAKLNMTVHRAS